MYMLSKDIAKRERLWQKKEEEEKLQVLVKWINEIEFLILSLSQSDYFGSFFPLVWTLSLYFSVSTKLILLLYWLSDIRKSSMDFF